MKTEKKIILIIMIFLTLFFSTKKHIVNGVILTDATEDVMHVIDDNFQSIGDVHPEIDIVSVEITTNNLYLTLKAAPNTVEYRRYLVEIYWDEVVEERGFNFYKNQTKCYFDSENHYSETKVYVGTTQIAGMHDPGAIRAGNVITWPIHIQDDDPMVDLTYFDAHNPATVFILTIYSETLDVPFPTGSIEEYFDFYPDDSQTYYTPTTTSTAKINAIELVGFSLIIAAIIIRYKKRK